MPTDEIVCPMCHEGIPLSILHTTPLADALRTYLRNAPSLERAEFWQVFGLSVEDSQKIDQMLGIVQ